MQRPQANQAEILLKKREGTGESPQEVSGKPLAFVAREDRDGRSRYRAAKMSAFADELGWYRVFYAPIFG